MTQTTLSSKGQVVIPKTIREKMGWKPGTSFYLKETEDGHLELIPLEESISQELFGSCSEMDLIHDLETEHRKDINKEKQIE